MISAACDMARDHHNILFSKNIIAPAVIFCFNQKFCFNLKPLSISLSLILTYAYSFFCGGDSCGADNGDNRGDNIDNGITGVSREGFSLFVEEDRRHNYSDSSDIEFRFRLRVFVRLRLRFFVRLWLRLIGIF